MNAVEAGDKERHHILVVEDDFDNQRLLETGLHHEYTVSVVRSVAAAKQVLDDVKIDLVILDLSLGEDEDGLDLSRYLRKQKRWRRLPIIAYTAHALERDRRNALDAGCDDYLAKPVSIMKLKSTIEKYLPD